MSFYLRLLHGVVQHGLIPSSWVSHQFSRSRTLADAAQHGCGPDQTPGAIKTVDSGKDISYVFPPLSAGSSTTTSASFASGDSFIATLHDCFVACCDDEYGQRHFAIFDHRGNYLRIDGFLYWPDHGRAFQQNAKNAQTVEQLVWPLRRWPKNHCHWITEDLPSILLAIDNRLIKNLVLPGREHATSFNSYCVSQLNLTDATSTDLIESIVRVKRLDLVRAGYYEANALKRLRSHFVDQNALASRKVYICREKAKYRKCANENEVWAELEERGFEKVFMEDLSPADQIETMAESKVIVGVHGAGMANIAFAPQDASIIEIVDAKWNSTNNELFLKLSSALAQSYTRLDGEPVDTQTAGGYRDLVVDIGSLVSALNAA